MAPDLFRFAVVLASTVALAAPTLAQGQGDDQLNGRFRVGYRGVDVNGQEGREGKYRQHYNLEDGPRLFEARFDYIAGGTLGAAVDTISFDIDNFGGDPFETLRFDVRKFGKYSFAYERVESTYFYDDIIYPPGFLDPSLDAVGDFTSFDVDRVRDHAAFDLTLTPRADLDFDFNRFTRRGDSTAPLRIEGDVFQLERPIDESNNELDVGFQYRWDKVSIAIQERVRDFENAAEQFLPGSSYAINLENEVMVDFFLLSQPYQLSSNQTTIRATLTPNPRWIVQVATSFENLDLDGSASEDSAGIDDDGIPFESDLAGSGGIQRDTRWFDGDVSYLVNERVSVVGSLWSNTMDQEGEFTFDAAGLGRWDISTTGVEGGIQFAAAEHITVTGGLRYESRTVDWDQSEDEPLELRTQETSHTGLFAAFNWVPRPAFSVNAEIETGSYDQPFTLASPSSSLRARVQANYRFDNGVYVTAMYLGRRLENDDRPEDQLSSDPNWNADRDNVNARVGYRRGGLDASAGYSFVRAANSVEQTLAIGDPPFLFPISFLSDANFVDGRMSWAFDPVWHAGGELRFYDNDGSFPLKRNDLRVYVEAVLATGYLVNVGYRYVDYEERIYGFNNYDANIVEASIGYVW